MVMTNHLWTASYLHEMLSSYVEKTPGAGLSLYREMLLAAQIVEQGIGSFDSGFSAFVQEHPDAQASSLYQVIRHFPDEAVRNGAALMIERLTTAVPGYGLLPLKTGMSGEPHMEPASLYARQRVREAACGRPDGETMGHPAAYGGARAGNRPAGAPYGIAFICQPDGGFRPEARPEIRECDCREVRPGVWAVEPQ